jgi:hypothetical protein
MNTIASSAVGSHAEAWALRAGAPAAVAVPRPVSAAVPVAGSRLFAEFVWVAFVAAQAADGVFTYIGMRIFGIEIEANPLIAFYAWHYGAGVAIVGAKGVAVASALILYTYGRHRTLGVLTIWYLLVAIWPWTFVLWP